MAEGAENYATEYKLYMENAQKEAKKLGLEGKVLADYLREERAEFRNIFQMMQEERQRKEAIAEKLRLEELEDKQRKEEMAEKLRLEEIEDRRHKEAVEAEERRRKDELEAKELERKYLLEAKKLELESSKTKTSELRTNEMLDMKMNQLPIFNDNKDAIDAFLDRFEKSANILKWDKSYWSLRLSHLLTGKALDVYMRMTTDDAQDYDKLKEALLRQYELTEVGYHKKFRTSRVESGETPSQFVARISQYFDRWITFTGIEKTYENLRDLMIRDQYLEHCSKDLAIYLKEKKVSDMDQFCTLATQYLDAHDQASGNSWKQRGFGDKGKKGFKGQDRGNGDKQKKGQTPSQDQGNNGSKSFPGQNKGKFCTYCKRNNHVRSQCRFAPKETSALTIDCQIQTCSLDCASFIDAGEVVKFDSLLDGKKVLAIRDSGCAVMVVRSSLVSPDQLTGDFVDCRAITGDISRNPVAKVEVCSPYYTGSVKACLMDNPPADLVIGNIPQIDPVRDTPDPNWKLPDIVPECNGVETRSMTKNSGKNKLLPLHVPDIIDGDITPEYIAKEQEEDETLTRVRENLKTGVETKLGEFHSATFFKSKGLIYRKFVNLKPNASSEVINQLVVPKSLRHKVMRLAHSGLLAGHEGTGKTVSRINAQFYWPALQQDVANFVRSCDVCQKTIPKGKVKKVPLDKMPLIDVPFKRCAVDLIGPLLVTRRKYRYILTMVDFATRYPEAVALKNIETETVAEALVSIFSRVGVPEELLTDQGSQFMSNILKEVGRLLSMKHLITSPYHPQCTGLVERFNGTLKSMLKRMCEENPEDWDRYLEPVLFAYREVPQDSTGFAPFELVYGRHVRGPLHILKEIWTKESLGEEVRTTYQYVIDLKQRMEETCKLAQEELKKSSSRYKYYFDKKAVPRSFKEGDQVLVMLPTDHNKLLLQWKGPYKVTKHVVGNDYKIEINGKIKTYHANMLKKYYEPERCETAGAVIADPGEYEETSIDSESLIHFPTLVAKEGIDDVHISPELSPKQHAEVLDVLNEFKDVITDVPGMTDLVSHSICLTSSEPIRSKAYKVPFAVQENITKEVNEMLVHDIIEPSNSPYSSPVVLVKKKDGSLRFCIDFRKINKVTVFDNEPMTDPARLMSRFGKSKYLTKIDLSKGYWQIPMDDASKDITSFITDQGLFKFKRLPFGLVNAAATLNRLLRMVLKDVSESDNYMDDIITGSEAWDNHLKSLREVLNRLRTAKLTVRPSKFFVGYSRLDCLGHNMGNGQIQPEEDKVRKIEEAPRPITKKQLQSFMGTVGFYNKYISNFSTVAAPLTDLLRKRQPNTLKWSEAHELAFQTLKSALTKFPILRLPDFSRPFIIRTDSSDTGMGAVLLQEYDDGKFPVSYASKKFKTAEKNYSVIERECLGLVWGIHKFYQYLYGKVFLIETDHKPLEYLQKAQFGNNKRLIHWALALQPFQYLVRALPGKDNVGADYLSRL